jgi:hypothetical protein
MKRRDFIAALVASAVFTRSWVRAQSTSKRPRLLISESDPFTGLDLLKLRYAAGHRPSETISRGLPSRGKSPARRISRNAHWQR